MNIVSIPSYEHQPHNTTLGKVILSDESPPDAPTAFIGKVGAGPKNSLYLIAYGHIILADDPSHTWTLYRCPVRIDRYVDVEMIVK